MTSGYDVDRVMTRDWREQAMDEALRAEAAQGSGVDALLRAIRGERPGAATLTLWHEVDRLQLRRFVEAATDARALLPGSDGVVDGDEVYPYTGWYGCRWQGELIEVALAPTWGGDGAIVLVGVEEGALRRFAAALADWAIRPAGRCLAYASRWRSAPELDEEIGAVTWDDLVLAPEVLRGVREAVEGFYRQRAAFAALGFGWRRGLLLVGPPGTGKTMVCKAAAAALPDLPFLYVRDFRETPGRDAIAAIFERARRLAPCILAFEDIDGLVAEYCRTVFLNELDGFRQNDGLLVIASSNHPEKIDEALLKRPSRFDRVFHLGLPAYAERLAYCRRMLARPALAARLDAALDREALARRVAGRSAGFTPAYLKEVFLSAALERAQAGALALDEAFAAAVLAQVEALRRYLRDVRDPAALADVGDAPAIGFHVSAGEAAPRAVEGIVEARQA